jgi:phosphotriesterase-related protein
MDVMTVTGPVPVEELGIILPHEHLIMAFDWPGLWPDVSDYPELVWQKVSIENLWALRRNYCAIRDNALLDSVDDACQEVQRFQAAGGRTIMEVSTLGLYGDPARLRQISERTGVNIIAGTGFYLDQTFPDEVLRMSVDDMYAVMMRDLCDGFPGTGVRAGFIGEVGISGEMTPAEERSLRASARAQRDAGVCMNIHIGSGMYAKAIAILQEEGANFKRLSFAHCDGLPLEKTRELVELGIYAETDCFGNEFYVDNGAYDGPWPWYFGNDGDKLRTLQRAIDAGLAHHLFFSQDVCSKMQTVNYGGYGYAHLLENILPMLEHIGVAHDTLLQIMTANVARYIRGE